MAALVVFDVSVPMRAMSTSPSARNSPEGIRHRIYVLNANDFAMIGGTYCGKTLGIIVQAPDQVPKPCRLCESTAKAGAHRVYPSDSHMWIERRFTYRERSDYFAALLAMDGQNGRRVNKTKCRAEILLEGQDTLMGM